LEWSTFLTVATPSLNLFPDIVKRQESVQDQPHVFNWSVVSGTMSKSRVVLETKIDAWRGERDNRTADAMNLE
jgi:hypothetical protein